MKVKSKTLYAIAALVVVVALYLLLNPPAPEFISTYSKDVNRFGPESVDMQLALGTLQRDPPHMIAPEPQLKPLLLFPPSQSDLERLSGPATTL
jgi:hypothetical protein